MNDARTAGRAGGAGRAGRAGKAGKAGRMGTGIGCGVALALSIFTWPAVVDAADDPRQIVLESQKRTDVKSQRYEGLLQVFDAKGKVSDKRWTLERIGAHGDSKMVLRFTAPALPSELDEAGITGLLTQLHRRGEATAQELLEVLEPAQRSAGARAVLWLRRVGLVTAA